MLVGSRQVVWNSKSTCERPCATWFTCIITLWLRQRSASVTPSSLLLLC
jgi:hypothetical protein